jgi:hypothetical protein
MIANELEDLGAPDVPLLLVLAHVLRQQRRILSLTLWCPRLLPPPMIRGTVVIGDAILEERAKLLS